MLPQIKLDFRGHLMAEKGGQNVMRGKERRRGEELGRDGSS